MSDTPATRPKFLSEDDCRDLLHRLARFAGGEGYVSVMIVSAWRGDLRWGRNQASSSGEVEDNRILVRRAKDGAIAQVEINDTTDAALLAAARRAERLMTLDRERPNGDLVNRLPLEPLEPTKLFSQSTYQLDADKRAAAAIPLIQRAVAAGMLSAGYIEVTAVGMGLLDSLGRIRYFPYTQARYSVTVRDPQGTGSGWAGDSSYDWQALDASALTARALDKCLRSRNPVAVEPGRYTTILEPQAVADFVGQLFALGGWATEGSAIDRGGNQGESQPAGPFLKSEPDYLLRIPGYSRLGEKVVDERITISANPCDPAVGFAPFMATYNFGGIDPFVTPVYHPVTWIDHGVLTHLAYGRRYGISTLGQDLGLPNSGAFRMSGGDTSIEEMISSTKRGLWVTRFDDVIRIDKTSQLYRGYTRDGLWLIENGKISKPVTNMVFTESILFALNNVDQLGVPQRVFHPNLALMYTIPQPNMVPALKIKDFSFTALADSI